jgi:hypothetical protein
MLQKGWHSILKLNYRVLLKCVLNIRLQLKLILQVMYIKIMNSRVFYELVLVKAA